MGAEGPEKQKSPWAAGAKFEKELDEEAVRKIREQQTSERSQGSIPLEQAKQTFEKIAFSDFRRGLIDANRFYTQTYQMDEQGRVVDPHIPTEPDLISCTPSELQRRPEGDVFLCKPDDLRNAALNIQKLFPDITFSFDEDRGKRTFTYTVRLEKP